MVTHRQQVAWHIRVSKDHRDEMIAKYGERSRCHSTTKRGDRCARGVYGRYCWEHGPR